MKASEIKEMTKDEIKAKVEALKNELFTLKMQKSMGQAENPMRLRFIRRDIARLKTVMASK